jgi:hypothetical protein
MSLIPASGNNPLQNNQSKKTVNESETVKDVKNLLGLKTFTGHAPINSPETKTAVNNASKLILSKCKNKLETITNPNPKTKNLINLIKNELVSRIHAKEADNRSASAENVQNISTIKERQTLSIEVVKSNSPSTISTDSESDYDSDSTTSIVSRKASQKVDTTSQLSSNNSIIRELTENLDRAIESREIVSIITSSLDLATQVSSSSPIENRASFEKLEVVERSLLVLASNFALQNDIETTIELISSLADLQESNNYPDAISSKIDDFVNELLSPTVLKNEKEFRRPIFFKELTDIQRLLNKVSKLKEKNKNTGLAGPLSRLETQIKKELKVRTPHDLFHPKENQSLDSSLISIKNSTNDNTLNMTQNKAIDLVFELSNELLEGTPKESTIEKLSTLFDSLVLQELILETPESRKQPIIDAIDHALTKPTNKPALNKVLNQLKGIFKYKGVAIETIFFDKVRDKITKLYGDHPKTQGNTLAMTFKIFERLNTACKLEALELSEVLQPMIKMQPFKTFIFNQPLDVKQKALDQVKSATRNMPIDSDAQATESLLIIQKFLEDCVKTDGIKRMPYFSE